MSAAISPAEHSCVISASPRHAAPQVGAITRCSITDFPGELAAVLFIRGCPWQCGYCHNTQLRPRTKGNAVSWMRALDFLHKKAEEIDAVVFSGGEPCVDPAITEAIWVVRKLGFKVGMHSSGSYPARLAEVLPWLDWIGLDIKAPFHRYESVTGVPGSGISARTSAETVLARDIPYEFRTTIHPALLSEGDILELAHTLAGMGVTNYALQHFRAEGCASAELKSASLDGYPSKALVEQVSGLFPHFAVR